MQFWPTLGRCVSKLLLYQLAKYKFIGTKGKGIYIKTTPRLLYMGTAMVHWGATRQGFVISAAFTQLLIPFCCSYIFYFGNSFLACAEVYGLASLLNIAVGKIGVVFATEHEPVCSYL